MAHIVDRIRSAGIAFFLAGLAPLAGAAPGDLDTTFGIAGRVSVGLGHSNDIAYSMVRQPDGRYVVAGQVENGATNDIGLARFTAAGGLDLTFGAFGRVTARIGTGAVFTSRVARDALGRYVVAGSATNTAPYTSMVVTRFLSDGTLDASFGTAGSAFIDFGFGSTAADIVVQPDGKLLVGGQALIPGDHDFALARLNADGTPDTSFNGTGRVVTAVAGDNDSVQQVLLQPDGRIIAAGSGGNLGGASNFALVRFDPLGGLDPTFGTGGIAIGPAGFGNAAARQADGKIVVSGYHDVFGGCTPECFHQLRVSRFNADGSADASFNGTGTLDVPRLDGTAPGTGDNITQSNTITVLATGKLLAGAYLTDASPIPRHGLVRINTNGTLDATFGAASPVPGSALVAALGPYSVYSAVDEGTFYTFATSPNLSPGGFDTDFGVVRVTDTGVIDTSFGGGSGMATLDFENGADGQFVAIAIQPDGRIVAGGSGVSPGFHVARFTAAGQLDATFGIGGRLILDFGNPNNALNALVLQPDGKIVVGGYFNNGATLNGALIRLNANGTGVDAGFGSGGLVTLAPGPDTFSVARLALQPDGKIVVAGSLTRLGLDTVGLWRVNADGTLDGTFGVGGLAEHDFAPGGDAEVLGLALQADGRIVAAGFVQSGANPDWLVARFNANGSLDAGFGTGGRYVNDVSGQEDFLFAVAVQADGKILAAGYAGDEGTRAGGIVRLNADGTLDAPFGVRLRTQGVLDVTFTALLTDGTGFYTTGYQALFDPGVRRKSAKAGPFDPSTILLRYRGDGTLDPAFPSVALALGADGSGMLAMARQADNKLVTAGAILGAPSGMYALARFLPAIPAPASIGPNIALTQSSAVGGSFAALSVTVHDAFGFPIQGLAVTFTAPAFGASAVLSSVTAITDVNGVATVGATANGLYGTYTVTASVGGLAAVVTFTLTNLGADAAPGATQVGFGNKDVGASYSSPPIQVRNAGNTPLTISSIVATGAGFGVNANCGAVLAPSATCTLTVTFLPTTEGYRTGQVAIQSNGIVSPRTIFVDGTGVDLSNPLGDADSDGIPNGVEPTVNTNPRSKDNDVFADARLFTMQQYRDFLNREGDVAGIDGWIALINTGAYTRLQVIDAFLSSQEFAGFVAPVVRLYFATFLRVPDYAGLTFNAGLVRNGTVTVAQLADFFTQSPEFQAAYGALNDTQFVTLLYNNVLNRVPDQAGLDGWVALLQSGYTRGQVLVGFSESTEYQGALANEVFVTMMYAGMLRRTPEPNGFNGWVGFLDAGTLTRTQVINGFFLSTEYHGRFLP